MPTEPVHYNTTTQRPQFFSLHHPRRFHNLSAPPSASPRNARIISVARRTIPVLPLPFRFEPGPFPIRTFSAYNRTQVLAGPQPNTDRVN